MSAALDRRKKDELQWLTKRCDRRMLKGTGEPSWTGVDCAPELYVEPGAGNTTSASISIKPPSRTRSSTFTSVLAGNFPGAKYSARTAWTSRIDAESIWVT